MSAGAATYESAVERLEEIIKRLDTGEAGLRETLDLCREGRELIEYSAGELDAVGKGLEELKLDELIERLEGAARSRPSMPGSGSAWARARFHYFRGRGGSPVYCAPDVDG